MPELPLQGEPERAWSLEQLGLSDLDPANLDSEADDPLEDWLRRCVGIIDETAELIRFKTEEELPQLRLQIRHGRLDAKALWDFNRTLRHLRRRLEAATGLLQQATSVLKIRVEVGERDVGNPLTVPRPPAPE